MDGELSIYLPSQLGELCHKVKWGGERQPK